GFIDCPISSVRSNAQWPYYTYQPSTKGESAVAERIVKSYKVLVGMEIHVQLATASKMFTGAANGFGGEPNSQVDPVVLGLPGVLTWKKMRASCCTKRLVDTTSTGRSWI